MAIDSAEKRYNLTGVGRPYLRSQFPIATPDEEWRIGAGLAYGGNALSVAPSFHSRSRIKKRYPGWELMRVLLALVTEMS